MLLYLSGKNSSADTASLQGIHSQFLVQSIPEQSLPWCIIKQVCVEGETWLGELIIWHKLSCGGGGTTETTRWHFLSKCPSDSLKYMVIFVLMEEAGFYTSLSKIFITNTVALLERGGDTGEIPLKQRFTCFMEQNGTWWSHLCAEIKVAGGTQPVFSSVPIPLLLVTSIHADPIIPSIIFNGPIFTNGKADWFKPNVRR